MRPSRWHSGTVTRTFDDCACDVLFLRQDDKHHALHSVCMTIKACCKPPAGFSRLRQRKQVTLVSQYAGGPCVNTKISCISINSNHIPIRIPAHLNLLTIRFLGRSSAGLGWGVVYNAQYSLKEPGTTNGGKSGGYKSGLTVLTTRPNSQFASINSTPFAAKAANSENPIMLRSDCPDTIYFQPPECLHQRSATSNQSDGRYCLVRFAFHSLYFHVL
jgi:hypothetical protein